MVRRACPWLVVLAFLGVSAWDLPAGAASPGAGVRYRDLCESTADGGRRCDVKIRTDDQGRFQFDAAKPNGGYAPADIQSAYGLPGNGGSGRIVALFAGNSDYTSAESDLGVYRAQYGLPACTTANGCFMKIDEHGGTSYPPAGTDEGEQALDMEMASASCPGCRIMLVEGGDMDVALATVKKLGVSAFSFSVLYGFGSAAASECTSLGFDDLSGLLVTGALGDTAYPGARDYVPATCQGALAVGGTTLNKAAGSARGWTETTWSGTGSGCSPYVAKPPWQTDNGCTTRMEADVAAVADPGTGLSFYFTQGGGGWGVVGGTSAASPLVAGSLTALGIANGQFTPAWVWQSSSNFFDITTGNNGTCGGSPSYFCTAGAGYDGPTGWGTPNGSLLATATPPTLGAGDAGAGCTQPGGSYLQTCSGCGVATQSGACVLTCQGCGKIDGTQSTDPSLTLPCTGTVVNDDGALVCSGGTTPMKDAGADAATGETDAGSKGDAGAKDASGPSTGDAGKEGGSAAVDASVDASAEGGGGVLTATTPSSGSSGCACTASSAEERQGLLALWMGLALTCGLLRRRSVAPRR